MLLRFTMTLFLIIAGQSLAIAKEEMTNIPSSIVEDLPEFWRSVMTEFYGPYDRKKKCWIGTRKIKGENIKYCMRPHVLKEILTPRKTTKYYVVVGGYKIEKGYENRRDNFPLSHAYGGVLGLILLEDGSEYLHLVARNSLYEEVGAWGQIPREEFFELRTIGPNGKHGWIIRSGDFHMGVETEKLYIFSDADGQFKKLYSALLSYDDSSLCVEGIHMITKQGCTQMSGTLQFFPPSIGGFYTISFVDEGLNSGKYDRQEHDIPFDINTMKYSVPKPDKEFRGIARQRLSEEGDEYLQNTIQIGISQRGGKFSELYITGCNYPPGKDQWRVQFYQQRLAVEDAASLKHVFDSSNKILPILESYSAIVQIYADSADGGPIKYYDTTNLKRDFNEYYFHLDIDPRTAQTIEKLLICAPENERIKPVCDTFIITDLQQAITDACGPL